MALWEENSQVKNWKYKVKPLIIWKDIKSGSYESFSLFTQVITKIVTYGIIRALGPNLRSNLHNLFLLAQTSDQSMLKQVLLFHIKCGIPHQLHNICWNWKRPKLQHLLILLLGDWPNGTIELAKLLTVPSDGDWENACFSFSQVFFLSYWR